MKSRRTRAGLAVLASAALVSSLVGQQLAFADHPVVTLTGSNFEIDVDANLRVDHASPSIDWTSVGQTRVSDTASGSGDESFGQGTKEDTAVPTVVTGGIPPNKSDLKEFGLFQEGTSSGGFLHLYWSRVQDPKGTTNMDFEFNQSATLSTNGVTPVRTVGDLLITYDLSNGGVNPTISRRTWTGSEWGPATAFGTAAAGSINTSPIPTAQSDGLGALDPRTFGEASIRLSAILPTGVCTTFGSAYLKSRASDVFTSALKDFVPPKSINVTNCGSVKINKTDDSVPAVALDGAGFTLYKNNAPLTAPRGAEDTITSPALTCTTAAGTCTISNVLFGNYWVVETTVPAGYTKADDQAVSVTNETTVVLNLVDPRIILPTSITTAQRFVPNDSATLTVASGNLAGNVVFQLFTSSTSCAGTAAYTSEPVPVAGASPQTVSSSNTRAYTVSTGFSWLVTYTSTNTGHLGAVSNCVEHSSVAINNNGPLG